jgi:Zn-finger nucleic acid-binding protein
MSRVEEQVSGAVLRSHSCPQCYGVWIPHVALLRRANIDAARAHAHLGEPAADHAEAGTPTAPAVEAPTASLEDLAAVVAETNSKKELRCPSCNKMLQKDRFHPLIPVMIDRCKPCGCSWLDAGEMPMIRRLYAELMSSDDPKVVELRQKTAGLRGAHPSPGGRQAMPVDGTMVPDTLEMLFSLLDLA